MTSRAITLGRNTPSSQVDFDLSLEAPAFKISRKQVWDCASVKGGREERRGGGREERREGWGDERE